MIFDGVVNILGQSFRVCEREIEGAGESCLTDRLIIIAPELEEEAKWETFYHEAIHMMLELGGYDTLLDPKIEEALAQYIGFSIHHFLANNSFEVVTND